MVDTLSTLSAEAKTFYRTDLLYRARQAQIFYDYGLRTPLPGNSGNTVSWRRFNALALATTALTESVTPSGTGLSLNEVTATVNQYGNHITYSDAVNTMAVDKIMDSAVQVLGQNGGESIEAVIRNVLQAGTNVLFATGSTRSAQGTSTPITLSLLRKALANLDGNNTHRFNGQDQMDKLGLGGYVAFVHPQVVYDIYNDTELKSALQYNASNDAAANLWTGYIGSIYGIQLIQSTLCPVFSGAGAGGNNVYGTIVVGMNAFGVVDVDGNG
ncbi:MAG: N4-gp56 family major capsid protein, partial [Cyanobacteria bacterium]|nr:N4-gp56 family major capsid protein [Cyanobacteriota bacterium]